MTTPKHRPITTTPKEEPMTTPRPEDMADALAFHARYGHLYRWVRRVGWFERIGDRWQMPNRWSRGRGGAPASAHNAFVRDYRETRGLPELPAPTAARGQPGSARTHRVMRLVEAMLDPLPLPDMVRSCMWMTVGQGEGAGTFASILAVKVAEVQPLLDALVESGEAWTGTDGFGRFYISTRERLPSHYRVEQPVTASQQEAS